MSIYMRSLSQEANRTNNDSSALAKGLPVLRVKERCRDLILSHGCVISCVCRPLRDRVEQAHTHYKVGAKVRVRIQSESGLVRKLFPETPMVQARHLSSFIETDKASTSTYAVSHTRVHTSFSMSPWSRV